MKIVVNARFLTQPVTGVQRFAIEISKILRQLNSDIVFVSPANILNQSLANDLGVIITGKNKGTVWEQVDLRKYLLTNGKPLLINFCNTGVLYYKKQVVTIHDMSYKVNPAWFSKRFYNWYNYLIPHIARKSLRVLTVSNASKTDIVNYLNIDAHKVGVIYNAVYLNTNNNFERRIKGRYLLTVSSLDPRKNLNGLITAFKKIDRDVQLIIVGVTNNNFSASVNTALLTGDIVLKGYVADDELSSLMHYAEAFVYLSFYEGFGLPPVEAMGMHCPVIVSDIPVHREVCGNAALYANPHDTEDIRDKMIELLDNDQLKQQLIIAGEQNIKRFSWFNSASEVLKQIDEFVKKH